MHERQYISDAIVRVVISVLPNKCVYLVRDADKSYYGRGLGIVDHYIKCGVECAVRIVVLQYKRA